MGQGAAPWTVLGAHVSKAGREGISWASGIRLEEPQLLWVNAIQHLCKESCMEGPVKSTGVHWA